MASDERLENSVRLLDQVLNTPQQTAIKLNAPRPRYAALTTSKALIQSEDFNDSTIPDISLHHGRLRRSDIFDLSVTLEPGELSQLCDYTVATETNTLKLDNHNESLYQQYQSVFQTLGNTQQVFEAISSFIEICTNRIETLYRERGITEDMTWLVNERNTWRLIQALYKDRSVKYDELIEDMLIEYTHERSEKELADYFYKTNRSVREAQIVIDWLEWIARNEWKTLNRPQMSHFTDKTVCWENTLHSIQNMGQIAFRSSRPVCNKLDPDGPRREGMPLHDLDMEDDRRLLRLMFLELRCGEFTKAQEHAKHCGQAWRASLLNGWKLCHDPNYAAKGGSTESKLPVDGNPHRDVWKVCAWGMCSDPRTSQEERAVLASLCGHLHSLLLQADSWEDVLWAYLKVLVDLRLEQEIRDNSVKNYVDMPSDYWTGPKSLETVFLELKCHDKSQSEASRPDRIIQELLILDTISELINKCSTWTESDCQLEFLRFLAHLILILRMLGRSEPVGEGDKIITAFVKGLMKERDSDAIAYYCSLLPEDLQLELYSGFMEQVGDSEERVSVLAAAERYQLNIPLITERAVRNIRNRKTDTSNEEQGLVTEVTEEDLEKISSLDWMVFYPQQRVQAMWEACALIRSFVVQGKLQAAKIAFHKVPSDSISQLISQYNLEVREGNRVFWEDFPAKVNAAIKEYLCYKSYLDAHEGFNHWFHQYHNTRPVEPILEEGADFTETVAHEHRMNRYIQEKDRWSDQMEHLTHNVKSLLNNVLAFPGGWLVEDVNLEDETRKSQLEALRSHCLPQIFELLFKVYTTMDLYDDAMDLFVTLMDEKHQFYKAFSQQKLEDMLEKVKEISEILLKYSQNTLSTRIWTEEEEVERPISPVSLLTAFPEDAPRVPVKNSELTWRPPQPNNKALFDEDPLMLDALLDVDI